MVKKLDGHLYETCEDWHPVVIKNSDKWMDNVIFRPAWLSENCPDADGDYDAWCHHNDKLSDPNHRTVYFFRDETVALLFALRWA